MGYGEDLGNPPLLVASDLQRIEIHTKEASHGRSTARGSRREPSEAPFAFRPTTITPTALEPAS